MRLPVITNGKVIYPLLIILVFLSLTQIGRIHTTGKAFPQLGRGEYLRMMEKHRELFPDAQYVQVYFPRSEGESSGQYYRAMDEYAGRFRRLSGITSVLAPTDLKDVRADDRSLETVALYEGTP